MRGLVLLLAALLSLASSSASFKTYRPEPVAAPAAVTDADLYAAVVRVFTDQGLSLRDNDVDAGVVSTEYVKLEDDRTDLPMTHSWRAVIEDATLRLSIDCDVYVDDRWQTCGDFERAEHWVAAVPRMRAAIFAEAQRRAARRRQKEIREEKAAEEDEPEAAPAAPPAPAPTPQI